MTAMAAKREFCNGRVREKLPSSCNVSCSVSSDAMSGGRRDKMVFRWLLATLFVRLTEGEGLRCSRGYVDRGIRRRVG